MEQFWGWCAKEKIRLAPIQLAKRKWSERSDWHVVAVEPLARGRLIAVVPYASVFCMETVAFAAFGSNPAPGDSKARGKTRSFPPSFVSRVVACFGCNSCRAARLAFVLAVAVGTTTANPNATASPNATTSSRLEATALRHAVTTRRYIRCCARKGGAHSHATAYGARHALSVSCLVSCQTSRAPCLVPIVDFVRSAPNADECNCVLYTTAEGDAWNAQSAGVARCPSNSGPARCALCLQGRTSRWRVAY